MYLFKYILSCYFGAILSKNIAIRLYRVKGITGARIGESVPLVVEALNTFINSINENAKPIPTAKFKPVPPRFFLHDNVTPIIVNII